MIKLICVGKIKEGYLELLIRDYEKRINKYHKLSILEVKDSTMDAEAKEIMKHINSSDYVIALALEGKRFSSISFADLIQQTFNHYGCITFVIGGSYGLSLKVKKRAQLLLSFSDMTMPHGLFRGVFLEQLYRAFKINNNEMYHK